MNAKEAVHRVFPTLTKIILFVLTFAAPGNMGREKMGEVDLPEVGIYLPLFEEFFYVPWRILHGSYLLSQGYFISISKTGWRNQGLSVIIVRLCGTDAGRVRISGFFGFYRFPMQKFKIFFR
jgi:hypothetical protein